MRPAARIRFFLSASLSVGTALAIFAACTDQTVDRPTPGGDISAPQRDAGKGTPGEQEETEDAEPSEPGTDAGKDAKPTGRVDGPGEVGAACEFNRDCKAALRCECDLSKGCACATGARGTGKNGVDTCDGGNQCSSSLCIDGPVAGEMVCSDECKDAGDCTGKLPRCLAVAGFSEMICVRNP